MVERTPAVRKLETYAVKDPEQDTNELRKRFFADLQSGALEIPPLPEAAIALQRLANNPDPDIQEAFRQAERDPNLAARVLQVTSSAAFGAGRPVTDLRMAVMRTGILGLRDIAFQLSMGQVFRCGQLEPRMHAVNAHSYAVAQATAYICKQLGIESTYGFLCGLLHDVGRVALLSALNRYGRQNAKWHDPEVVDRVCDALHEQVGGLVLSSWGVQSQVKSVAMHHHQPQSAGAAMAMAMAVSVADQAAHIEADTPDARAAALAQMPVAYQAGLDPGCFLRLCEIIGAALDEST